LGSNAVTFRGLKKSFMKVKLFYFQFLLLVIAFQTNAQKKVLSDEQLLKGARTNITQPLPQVAGWIDDSHLLLNKKVNPDSPARVIVLDCKTGKESPGSMDMLKKGALSSRNVVLKEDDLYLKEGDQPEIRLTQTPEKEINPTRSPDNKYVAFTRNNDLYTINLDTKKETRITSDGSELILNGYASWVYFEEILGRATRYRSFWWSPDSKSIAFMRMDDTKVPVFPIFNENGQHGSLENTRYPKPGDPNPEVKIGMASPESNQVTWADFDAKADQYFGMPYWRPDGKALWVQWMNRGQDNLKVYEVNLTNGSKKEIYDEKQKTWIDLDDQGGRITFLEKTNGFILQSDKDGWENIYLYNLDGTLKNKITDGNFWSSTVVKVDETRQLVYFTARKENSTRTDFYVASLDGKKIQRLSFGDYTHRVDLSPGGSYFVTIYSNSSTPERLALVDQKGKLVKELGDAKGPEFDQYEMARTEILRVKSEDGLYDLPIRITWPLNYDKSKKYPVMINIYGGPNAGTVRDGWQFSGQQQWWAKEGLIQVAMDHRASGHFGKNGINYMHRSLGQWELKDWITIVKWLRVNGADSARIGISGFSYGGYMTCMALTAGADYFTHGLAGGSVVDWQLYDSHYTERFMDTPAENPEGYKAGAILTYVDKYKGLLRIYHGTMDDNVHMQNSIQLIKRLQENKKHFEFMVYPGGRHGWGGNQSMHSTNENNMFIYKNLLQKEMPKAMLR
jgi:dipeptidyl-peptidase-4